MSDLLGVTWLTLKALVPGRPQSKPLTRTDPELHPDLMTRLTTAPAPLPTATVGSGDCCPPRRRSLPGKATQTGTAWPGAGLLSPAKPASIYPNPATQPTSF
ncbi:MAG: hypothetical protein AB1801_25980 [Chloroflexota bacterium]